jgi:pimeloyl-ACP methyl ester carboxylesterase
MELQITEEILVRSSSNEDDLAIWCLPGFADSGLAFSTFYNSKMINFARILTPDLPGFGASPINNHPSTIDAYVETLLKLIDVCTPNQNIGLIGHSVGSIIAVEAALQLNKRCQGVFSIEGNLTKEDAYFSGQAVNFDTASEFKRMFTETIWQKGSNDEIFRAYYSGLKQADETAMWYFGKDVKRYSEDNRPGKEALGLECPFTYFWCPDNTPVESQDFIATHQIENIKVEGTSHWPMIDAAERTINNISTFFR